MDLDWLRILTGTTPGHILALAVLTSALLWGAPRGARAWKALRERQAVAREVEQVRQEKVYPWTLALQERVDRRIEQKLNNHMALVTVRLGKLEATLREEFRAEVARASAMMTDLVERLHKQNEEQRAVSVELQVGVAELREATKNQVAGQTRIETNLRDLTQVLMKNGS